MAKPKPITAYPIANGVRVEGIKIVKKPRDVAAKNITLPTNFNAAALLVNFEFCHIFPAKANKVIAIIRIDQTIWSLLSKSRRSKKSLGAIRRKIAEAPKTALPAFKVCLIPCWYM